MLEFYESKIGLDDPSPTKRHLGGFGIEVARELDSLRITNSREFNGLHFFEDQFFDPENVQERLELALKLYEEAQSTPGYKSHGVETYINILQLAADENTGIRTICD